MRITAAHTENKSNFLIRMLLRVRMKASGFRKHSLGRAIIAAAKAIDKKGASFLVCVTYVW